MSTVVVVVDCILPWVKLGVIVLAAAGLANINSRIRRFILLSFWGRVY